MLCIFQILKRTYDIGEKFSKINRNRRNGSDNSSYYVAIFIWTVPYHFNELEKNIKSLSSFAIGVKAADAAHRKGDLEKGLDQLKSDYEKLFYS